MAKYCWDCANIGRCKYASGKVISCNRFNPYLTLEEFCVEMGMSVKMFYYYTRGGRSISSIQRDARAKGIIVIKDYSMKKKKIRWVIYRKKM